MKRPVFNTKQNYITKEEWESLPKQISVRLIRLGYETRTGERKIMTVATTLTDEKRFDGLELHCLYARRWEIELKLRDIKTTMNFEMINVKTPEMAVKTLAMVKLAYNLIRVLMKRAAHASGITQDSISFKESLELVTSMAPSFKAVAGRPRKLSSLRTFCINLISTKRLKYRPYRSEPRAVKRRPKPFALLTKIRSEYVEIPHRSRYRAHA